MTLTVQAVKDGSDMQAEAHVDPQSTDANTDGGQETKIACPFAGKSIVLTRHPDETFTNDFKGAASRDDNYMLNNFLMPDSDLYPDDAVAVGDVWDSSVKLARHIALGPKDQELSKCRLDWVKMIDGKQMAQISNSAAMVFHEDNNVEEDVVHFGTDLIDLAAGIIVKSDEKQSTTYKTPATQAMQLTGGTTLTYHSECVPNVGAGAQKPK